MKSTTKVIISFSFPIEHLSVFYLLVTESEERLVFSEMLNILDCLQKLSVTVRKVRGKNRLSSVVKSSENSRNYSNKSSCVITIFWGGTFQEDVTRFMHCVHYFSHQLQHFLAFTRDIYLLLLKTKRGAQDQNQCSIL